MQLAGSRGFVEAISFCVKFVYVEVFSLLPKKDVSSKHLLHNLDSHVTDTGIMLTLTRNPESGLKGHLQRGGGRAFVRQISLAWSGGGGMTNIGASIID